MSTLRAWERRFHFLEPHRSPAGPTPLSRSRTSTGSKPELRLVSEGLDPAGGRRPRLDRGHRGPSLDGEGEALLFGQILQVAGQGVWVSRDGRTRYANRRMAELMGCSVEDLLVIPVLDFHPEDIQVTKERVKNGAGR